MARLAGAVHVATTDGPSGRRGVTVAAATSVSDSPPTLLICLNRNREENRQFFDNGSFVLNTLDADQLDIARAFAGEGQMSMEARFKTGQWYQLQTGAPVLTNSLMSLDCVVTDVQTVATHYVIFGQAVGSRHRAGGKALLYAERGYHVLETEKETD